MSWSIHISLVFRIYDMTVMVELGRVDAGTANGRCIIAATNSRWVFQTSVDVTSIYLSIQQGPRPRYSETAVGAGGSGFGGRVLDV